MKTLTMLASALLLVVPTFADAQTAQIDARWQPWLGCWTQVGSAVETLASPPPAGRLSCVVPTAGTSAVDIVTLADRRVVSREDIEDTRAPRPSERGGWNGRGNA